MRSRLAIALTLMAAAGGSGASAASGAVVSGSNLAQPLNSYVYVGQQQGSVGATMDGYGDETRGKCPGRADSSNGCPLPGGGPVVPDDHAPTTTIDEVRIQKGRATFRFSSPELFAKFRCKLDRKPWKKCKSPKVYKGLKAGRHSFKVKAIGTNGMPDRTPAKRSFRVTL